MPSSRPELTNVAFLSTVVTSPHIEVGDCTYYDDPHGLTAFETRNVLYDFGSEKLRIGRFCALAAGTRARPPAIGTPPR